MIYIGIGSNLGNRINYIEKAKYYLHINGINIIKSSRYYETLSWPDIRKPKFINIVIQTDTRFSPKRYLKIFKHKKGKKNDPRTCDIDIISYDQKISINSINLPHKRMHKRNFVLIPLYEIDKNWFHPKLKNTIKSLIFSLPIKDIRSIKQI